MLRKINNVTGFGLFRNFSWGTLQEFKRYNLIYGWNYSGKTTLSKILQTLQHGVIPNDFLGCQFQATFDGGSVVASHALTPLAKVRVFNRAFIDENFSSEMVGAKMIVVVGAENQKLKKRLGDLEKRQAKVLDIKMRFESKASEIENNLNASAKREATIVSNLFGIGRYYNRTHFLSEVQNLPEDFASLVLSDADKDKMTEEWRKAEDYKNLDLLNWSTGALLKNVHAIRRVLKTTASYKAIEELRRDSKIEKWVFDGLSLNARGKTCEFCGSVITDARWNKLQEHFSKAYKELLNSVRSLIAIVSEVKCEIHFLDADKLFPDLKTEYHAKRDEVSACLLALKSQLKDLSAALEKKSANLESVQHCEIDFSVCKQLRGAIKDCNSVIKKHNDKVASAAGVRDEAKGKIIKHYAAKYFTDEDYKNKTEEIKRLKERAADSQITTDKIGTGIATVQDDIKAASIAANKINDRLKSLLPDDDIEAVKVSDTDFEFQRNGQPARNMSEGERTAVALAHFLAKLEEGAANIGELIVVLDDPICSFDSNHVYAMYSIIERNLSAAKQLIILTHNADFFGLVKDWMKSRDKSFYMVNRHLNANHEWFSNLIPLPRLLEKFKSDYLYTYHCLQTIHANPAPTLEEMCGVPNMVRRFLEIYLGFRYPNSKNPAWHEKLDMLFDDENKRGEVQKFADDLSHVHYLHRAMQVPDYVQHCKRMVKDVLDALKSKDPNHVAALDAELNP